MARSILSLYLPLLLRFCFAEQDTSTQENHCNHCYCYYHDNHCQYHFLNFTDSIFLSRRSDGQNETVTVTINLLFIVYCLLLLLLLPSIYCLLLLLLFIVIVYCYCLLLLLPSNLYSGSVSRRTVTTSHVIL